MRGGKGFDKECVCHSFQVGRDQVSTLVQCELEELVERLAQEGVRVVCECPEVGVRGEGAIDRVLSRKVFFRELSCGGGGIWLTLGHEIALGEKKKKKGGLLMRWPTVSTQHAITRANFVSASSGETWRSSLSDPVLSFAITFVQYSRMLVW